MIRTCEQITIHVRRDMGEDISTELQNLTQIVLEAPKVSEAAQERLKAIANLRRENNERSLEAHKESRNLIDEEIAQAQQDPTKGSVRALKLERIGIVNTIATLQAELQNPPEEELRGSEKGNYAGLLKSHHTRMAKLVEIEVKHLTSSWASAPEYLRIK